VIAHPAQPFERLEPSKFLFLCSSAEWAAGHGFLRASPWQSNNCPVTRPRAAARTRASEIGGLYRSGYERDSCGFGLIASLDDQASHWVLETAISSLNRLTHRGAIATDGKTGDGCGLLIKMPTRFLREVAVEAGFSLTPRFAAGLVFLDPDPGKGAEARRGAGRRDRAGKAAGGRISVAAHGSRRLRLGGSQNPARHRAGIRERGPDIDESTLNRKLYMARRRAEKLLEPSDPLFYIPSLSASTIVYKGMVMPKFLAQFYPDLKDPRMEASVVVFHQRFSTNTLPQWRLAHPYRYLAHNGEINTVQGNRSWAVAARAPVSFAGVARLERRAARGCP